MGADEKSHLSYSQKYLASSKQREITERDYVMLLLYVMWEILEY